MDLPRVVHASRSPQERSTQSVRNFHNVIQNGKDSLRRSLALAGGLLSESGGREVMLDELQLL
jgi:hypothetical protein